MTSVIQYISIGSEPGPSPTTYPDGMENGGVACRPLQIEWAGPNAIASNASLPLVHYELSSSGDLPPSPQVMADTYPSALLVTLTGDETN